MRDRALTLDPWGADVSWGRTLTRSSQGCEGLPGGLSIGVQQLCRGTGGPGWCLVTPSLHVTVHVGLHVGLHGGMNAAACAPEP